MPRSIAAKIDHICPNCLTAEDGFALDCYEDPTHTVHADTTDGIWGWNREDWGDHTYVVAVKCHHCYEPYPRPQQAAFAKHYGFALYDEPVFKLAR
jgi:hypothetical protein